MDHAAREHGRPRFVVIGGGTGIIPCLQGLKAAGQLVAAVVTVADDGGSSGRLRKDYQIPPPGDIRNCLVALATTDPLIVDLFNFRFDDAILRGHSFGNLFLAVLTRLTGDFRRAVDEARRLLGVEHRVLPSTETRVVLVAEHPDGTKSTGEQVISHCGKPIHRMALRPRPPEVSTEIRELLMGAAVVVLGPGSLYTSIIPNLLVPGLVETLERIPGRIVLVTNLMTQPGETDGFDAAAHVRSLLQVACLRRLDAVVCNDARVPDETAERYRTAGSTPVTVPPGVDLIEGARVVRHDLLALTGEGKVRHHGERLAGLLLRLAGERP